MTDQAPGHGQPWQPEQWPPDVLLTGEAGWNGEPVHGGQPPYGPGGPAQPSGTQPAGEQPAGVPEQGGWPQQAPQGGADPGWPDATWLAPPPQAAGPSMPYGNDWAAGNGWQTGQSPAWPPAAEPEADNGWGAPPGWDGGRPGDGYPAAAAYPVSGRGEGGYAVPPADGGTGYREGRPDALRGGDPAAADAATPVRGPGRAAPPAQRGPAPPERGPERTAEWSPFDEDDDGTENHPFFTGAAEPDGLGPAAGSGRASRAAAAGSDRRRAGHGGGAAAGGRARRGRAVQGGSRRRSGGRRRGGAALLTALAVLGGVVLGGGYEGFRYYQNHLVPPPDYTGAGTGSVQVSVPASATLAQIGNILKRDGVVESVDAFTRAAAANSRAVGIQGGIYLLHRRMSAAGAVTMMLDPAAQSALIVPEGWRASQVYQALDARLGLPAGTTAADAGSADLGLPPYVPGGNPEGFLYPSKYSAAKGGDPVRILQQMVRLAQAEFAQDGLAAGASRMGRTPYQIIVIASLIQAEAQAPQDFGKVSRVIYNRLAQNMALGFDSTINYAKGRSTLNTTDADTQFASPYNTYLHKGLPPGPIDNPGHQAIEAALNPTPGGWLYFVTVKPGDTRFSVTAAEHERNVQAFNQYQQEHGG